MSNLRIRIRVTGIDDVTDDIEDAIKQGIQDGGGEIIDHSQKIAKTHIREKAYWTGELLQSWLKEESAGRMQTYHGMLENTAPHAAPIEHGASYGAEGPPIEELIPWVRSEMNFIPPPGWRPEDDSMDPEALDKWNDVTNFVTDPMTLRKAFWLQQHIKEEGITAVHYMRDARMWAEARGSEVVAEAIDRQFKKQL